MGMNRALVGREYTKMDPVTVAAEAARAYADATNARIAAYEGAEPMAPPMYGVAYTFAGLGAPLFDPELQVDMMRLVHGDQDMSFLRPVRPGDTITTSSRVVDIVEKTSGEIITVGITAKNQGGEVVLEAKSGLFVRGPRKKENIAAEKSERDAEEAAWAEAPVAWTAEEKVAQDQSVRYAEASGDRNPIHLEGEVAKMAGLPGIILHGLCTMAFVHNACVRQLGGEPMRVKRLAVRFNRPVLMGDTLTIEARGPTAGPWQLRVTNQSGVAVLKNGVAEVA
jgi:(3R)-3-hydroxyacyl-CoA dehydrogenase / 3a,7a,12a-trihydroxy-5b-cholest-24-enoyl-CoA hydratase / enoyl-CoA hydratase 2